MTYVSLHTLDSGDSSPFSYKKLETLRKISSNREDPISKLLQSRLFQSNEMIGGDLRDPGKTPPPPFPRTHEVLPRTLAVPVASETAVILFRMHFLRCRDEFTKSRSTEKRLAHDVEQQKTAKFTNQ